MASDSDRVDRIAKFAALQSMTELGLGSFMHAFQIPLAGQALSLNQILILSRLTRELKSQPQHSGSKGTGILDILSVANITALLKSISPAGKKLTPMLAISAQGFLFAFGVGIFGFQTFGILVGAMLASIWAFLQPLLIGYLLFGQNLISAAVFFFKKSLEFLSLDPSNFLVVALVFVALKAGLAVVISLLAFRLPESRIDAYFRKLLEFSKDPAKNRAQVSRVLHAVDHGALLCSGNLGSKLEEPKPPLYLAFQDMKHPLFLVSLILVGVFFIFSGQEAPAIIFGILRPLTCGLLLFYLVRKVPYDQIAAFAESHGFSNFASALRLTAQKIQETK